MPRRNAAFDATTAGSSRIQSNASGFDLQSRHADVAVVDGGALLRGGRRREREPSN
jgi:hypothetical protein